MSHFLSKWPIGGPQAPGVRNPARFLPGTSLLGRGVDILILEDKRVKRFELWEEAVYYLLGVQCCRVKT